MKYVVEDCFMEPTQPGTGPNELPSEMAEIINEFLIESNEGLDRFDRDLLALEKDANSRELLDSIFRAVHTIKGTGGVLGFDKLVSLSHVGESVLSRMRDGVLTLTPEIATALLAMADSLRRMLASIAATGSEGNEEFSAVLEKLSALSHSPAKNPEPVSQAVPTEPDALVDGQRTQPDGRDIGSNTIRVDVALLDKVMNLVGELVLARNQVLQFTDQQEDSAFLGTAQRLNLITTELQEGVMKTRMQPIGNVWSKLPRIVRDLSPWAAANRCEVEMEGTETELDKTIIEAIKDPLTHIIRNAVDHGIETPEIRVARRQAAEGRLLLRAFHEGGQVNIEISDDGGGIDSERAQGTRPSPRA